MLKTPKEELQWLINLQNDLIKDRKEEKGNASPLYYGLREPYEQLVPDGYGDKTVFYDREAAEEQTLDEIWDAMSIEEKKEAADDFFNSGVIETDNWTFEIADESDFIDYICEKNNLEQYEISIEERLACDHLFLTRNAATEYLDKYGYNHPAGTVTYAMTAVRSPQYEHLLELLHNMDWEHSQIQFQIPEDFWTEQKLKNKLYDYLDDNLDVTANQMTTIYNRLYEFLKTAIEWRERIVNGKTQRFCKPNALAAKIAYWLKKQKGITIETPFC